MEKRIIPLFKIRARPQFKKYDLKKKIDFHFIFLSLVFVFLKFFFCVYFYILPIKSGSFIPLSLLGLRTNFFPSHKECIVLFCLSYLNPKRQLHNDRMNIDTFSFFFCSTKKKVYLVIENCLI